MRKLMVLLVLVMVLPLLAEWEYGHDYEDETYPMTLLSKGVNPGFGVVWEVTTIDTDGTIVAQALLKNNYLEDYEVTFFTYELGEEGFPTEEEILPLPPDNYFDSEDVALPQIENTYDWLPYDGVELEVPMHGRVGVGVRIFFHQQKVNLRGCHPDSADRSAYWKSSSWEIIGNSSRDPDWCIRWTDGDGSPVTEVSWGVIKARF